MTVEEITNQAIKISANKTIDLLASRRFINEAMSILANTYDNACVKNTIDIDCTDVNAEYELPVNFMGVTRVTRNGLKVRLYTVTDGYIAFDVKGTYAVRYLTIPKLTDRKTYQKELKTDSPGIHLSFHAALPFYVASQMLFIENPSDPKASGYMSRFNAMCEDANNRLEKGKRKGARIAVPKFR